jgi:hypothetical protein
LKFARRYATFIVLSFFVTGFCFGTVIVVRPTKNSITIGADTGGVDEYGTKKSESVCKIWQFQKSNVFYSFSGVIGDTSTGYDLGSLLQSISGESKTISALAVEVENAIGVPLRDTALHTKLTDPKGYVKNFMGVSVVSVVLADFESGVMNIFAKDFSIKERDGRIDIDVCDIPCHGQACQGGNNSLLDGEYGAILEISKNKEFWKRGDVKGVADLIRTQKEATPDKVFGQTEILKITRSSAYWVDNPLNCPEPQEYPRKK